MNPSVFENCKNLSSVIFPQDMLQIPASTSSGCSGFTSFTIQDGIENIGSHAFDNCDNLSLLSLPSSIKYIGDEAFANCTSIEDVYCHATTVPDMGKKVFSNSYVEYSKLYVEDGVVNDYQSASQWMDFGQILGFSASSVTDIPDHEFSIRFANGTIYISGCEDGDVIVYDINGNISGRGKCKNGECIVETVIQRNSYAIIKTERKTIKVLL